MKKPNDQLSLPVGHVSDQKELGKYYQDFSQALHHFDQEYFGQFDEKGLPMLGFGDSAKYNQVYIIQYGLISLDLIKDRIDVEKHMDRVKTCVQWMEDNEEYVGDAIVWRNHFDFQRYGLKSGWISGMYQGQAISLYLRYGQLIDDEKYVEKALRAFAFFDVMYEDGGVRRYDKNGNLWFEEYPSEQPSFVLNGFVYGMFGILDLWRVSGDQKVKTTLDACLKTLKESVHLYDSGYWSVYDQLKKELATRYYHKNIHIPLLEILYQIQPEEVFLKYKKRWEKQLNSKINHILVDIMYRVRPRLQKFQKR